MYFAIRDVLCQTENLPLENLRHADSAYGGTQVILTVRQIVRVSLCDMLAHDLNDFRPIWSAFPY